MQDDSIFSLYTPKEKRSNTEKKESKKYDMSGKIGLGIAEGSGEIANLGMMAQGLVQSPLSYTLLDEQQRKVTQTPGQRALGELEGQELTPFQLAMLADEDILPPLSLPGGREATREFMEKIPKTGVLQESINRGIRSLPALVAGPAGYMAALGSEARGLAAKEAVKAMGGGETAQSIADLLGGAVTPRKGVIGSKGDRDFIKEARKLVLSDKDITPLVQSERKQKLLSNLAKKTGKTESQLKSTKKVIDGALNEISTRPQAQQALSNESKNKLIQGIESKLKEIPDEVQKLIKNDYKQLQESGFTGADVINFYRDVGYNIGPKSRQLVTLKEPIKDAIASIDRNLHKDFLTTNKMYEKFSNISQRLKPNLVDNLISKSAPIRMLVGLSTGMTGLITEAVGEVAARKISTEMLMNPKYQNLGKKSVSTLNSGRIKAMKKLVDNYSAEISKVSPEAASQLRQIDWDEFESIYDEASSYD